MFLETFEAIPKIMEVKVIEIYGLWQQQSIATCSEL